MKRLILLTGLLLHSNYIAIAQVTAAPASIPATGSWKVDGNVQGVPVILTCGIVETDKDLSGSCTGDDGSTHTIKGTVKDKVVTWAFDSAYQGQAITVTMSGTIDATGMKMTGSIAVDPLQADGLFTATKQPAVVPVVVNKPTSTL
jgi:hypothetical protein